MQSNDLGGAIIFGPAMRRPPLKPRRSWGAVLRTLALLSTLFLSFFGVYELDQYWNGGRGGAAWFTIPHA